MSLPLAELAVIATSRLARAQARPLFITISGAHLYGFASPDSDFDVRGAHLLDLDRLVSLRPGRETIELSETRDGRQIDLVSHEAAKFFRLMLNRNGYVMEQVFSPLVAQGGDPLNELRDIARGCITRRIAHHYQGFFRNQVEMHDREDEKKAKTLLYAYRVALTGIHVLRTGTVEAHLPTLLQLHPTTEAVTPLLDAKRTEHAGVDRATAERHRNALNALGAEIDQAALDSHLPEEPCRAADLDAFLVRLRSG